MLNCIYKFSFSIKNQKGIIMKIKNKWNVLLGKIVNLYMPIYYKIFKSSSYGLNENVREEKVLISLTTIPSRITQLKICLETLMRQTFKPDKILLWVDEEKFDKEEIVDFLMDYIKRGLEIKFCKDIKVHTKYYYAMRDYKDYIIITVDDDCYYPENLVKNLINEYKKDKNSVICYRAHKITLNEEGKINKYLDWIWCSPGMKEGRLLLPTGVGGVLYPINIFGEEVFNKELFLNLCSQQDDLWLKIME